MHIWITLSGPGHQHQEPFFDLKFYWKPGYNISL